MITAILAVYGSAFFALGVIFIIVTAKPREYDEKLSLRKARAKRARVRGLVKHRVQVDARIRRHRANGDRYHYVGERMWSSEIPG